jgi:macrolide-specific efflux system membrane fusion protein
MRKLVVAGAGIGAVAVAVAVLGWASGTRRQDAAAAAGADVVRVVRRDLETIVKATGVIKPMIGAEVRVGSRASGVVKRLLVRVGDAVRQGQLLAELDDRELAARRTAAAAALELSEATLAYARADFRRKQQLRAASLIAPSDLDLALQAASVAEQQCNQARANLDDATTQAGYAHIVAPISGIVASVSTQEGETVASSFASPTFVTLLDLARLEVRAYVDETDIGRIRRGQPARFTVDTYADHEFDGRVTAIYPQAEIRDNVVNYVTVVRFASPRDRLLRPEMTTTVRIALDRREQVLVLPLRAVRREGGRTFVLCPRVAGSGDGGGSSAGGGSATERRWVTTGLRDDSYWEIIDGLREGDTVIVGDAKTE